MIKHELCQQETGFIFKGACTEPADAFCHFCRLAICRAHTHLVQQFILCLNCTKTELARNNDQNPTDTSSISDRTNPYHYSYNSYSSQNSDFNATDRAKFDQPTDTTSVDQTGDNRTGDNKFEQDFAGS